MSGGGAYKSAGVDIDGGNSTVDLIRSSVASTHGPSVISGTGLFAGAFQLGDDVLVSSTDSVGTKVRLAARLGRHRNLGVDLVNHCVNDILVMGAEPLFFLDYFASSRLVPEVVAELVDGIADACRDAGCALLGGETAELPGVYAKDEYDVAGFIVGRVEKDSMLPRPGIAAGDLLIGLPSSGLHTNGFSLVNHILDAGGADRLSERDSSGRMLADVLLEPHRSYLAELRPIVRQPSLIRAAAHITGGGMIDNLPRVLPPDIDARIYLDSWQVPDIFRWVQQAGGVADNEMYRVFNMGVGMILVVQREQVDAVMGLLPEGWVLGTVVPGERRVRLVGNELA